MRNPGHLLRKQTEIVEINKNRRAIVFSFSADQLFAVGTALLNLNSINDLSNVDVLLFTGKTSKQSKDALGKIHPVKFRESKITLDTRQLLTPSIRQFTPNVLSKLNCIDLLDEYEQVLLLDYDLVFKKSIVDIFEVNHPDLVFVPGGVQVREQFIEPISTYDLDREGMHAGVVLFNRTQKDNKKMFEFVQNSIQNYLPKLLMPEQAILDLLIQEFELNTHHLSLAEWACHPNLEIEGVTRILHCYGHPKFWSGLENDIWNSNYSSWVQLSGCSYRGKTRYSRIIKKINIFYMVSRVKMEDYMKFLRQIFLAGMRSNGN
jgi:lipopolysaccharide biosynthesis glycosyltransferase